jgi:hypothetical protein
MMVAVTSFADAKHPDLRTRVEAEESEMTIDGIDNYSRDVEFPYPKVKFGFEKGLSCNGEIDLKGGGAGKQCDATMKKTVIIGMPVEKITDGIASDMEKIFHDLVPEKDGFLPVEGDMITLAKMDEIEIDGMGDGASKTVKFGGFFKLNWNCTVTMKKEGPLKLIKTIECGAKALEGKGGGPNDFDEDVEEYKF